MQLFLANGDREDMLAGRYVTTEGADWPIPGTTWETLHLDATPSGTATSINDGTLRSGRPARGDAVVPGDRVAADGDRSVQHRPSSGSSTTRRTLTDMTLAEPQGLSYTTEPFAATGAGGRPGQPRARARQHRAGDRPLRGALGRVARRHRPPDGRRPARSAYPGVDVARSLVDADGDIVQPYGRYDVRDPAAVGQERRYHVELWPIGNQFDAGHRLRLHVLGVSGASQPDHAGREHIRLGDGASRLLLPRPPRQRPRRRRGLDAGRARLSATHPRLMPHRP